MTKMMTKLDADGNIVAELSFDDFLKFLNEKIYEYDRTHYEILCRDADGNPHPYKVMSLDFGRKFVKVVEQVKGSRSRSVYCFLDYSGNIYKAASWKAPAKHVRGSVFNKDHGWGSALGPYGATYLR